MTPGKTYRHKKNKEMAFQVEAIEHEIKVTGYWINIQSPDRPVIEYDALFLPNINLDEWDEWDG